MNYWQFFTTELHFCSMKNSINIQNRNEKVHHCQIRIGVAFTAYKNADSQLHHFRRHHIWWGWHTVGSVSWKMSVWAQKKHLTERMTFPSSSISILPHGMSRMIYGDGLAWSWIFAMTAEWVSAVCTAAGTKLLFEPSINITEHITASGSISFRIQMYPPSPLPPKVNAITKMRHLHWNVNRCGKALIAYLNSFWLFPLVQISPNAHRLNGISYRFNRFMSCNSVGKSSNERAHTEKNYHFLNHVQRLEATKFPKCHRQAWNDLSGSRHRSAVLLVWISSPPMFLLRRPQRRNSFTH